MTEWLESHGINLQDTANLAQIAQVLIALGIWAGIIAVVKWGWNQTPWGPTQRKIERTEALRQHLLAGQNFRISEWRRYSTESLDGIVREAIDWSQSGLAKLRQVAGWEAEMTARARADLHLRKTLTNVDWEGPWLGRSTDDRVDRILWRHQAVRSILDLYVKTGGVN